MIQLANLTVETNAGRGRQLPRPVNGGAVKVIEPAPVSREQLSKRLCARTHFSELG